jgi:hypothetical protein
LDSGGLQAAVARYERKAEMQGGGGDDSVGHVWDGFAGNGSESVGNSAIHDRDR